jgi:hypothetical protein
MDTKEIKKATQRARLAAKELIDQLDRLTETIDELDDTEEQLLVGWTDRRYGAALGLELDLGNLERALKLDLEGSPLDLTDLD